MDPNNNPATQQPQDLNPQTNLSPLSTPQTDKDSSTKEEKPPSMENKHTYISAILLLYFWPIGVIYALIFTKWPKRVKIILILPFILVFLGILAIIASIFLIAANPAGQILQENDTNRQSEVTQILNAIRSYSANNNGKLPAGIISTEAEISSNGADICGDIIGLTLPSLPVDPSMGQENITDCSSNYNTGYYVVKNQDGSVTVSAPLAEDDIEISITR